MQTHAHPHSKRKTEREEGRGRRVGEWERSVRAASPCVPRMYLAYFVICINTGNGNDSHDTEMARHLISMQPARDSIAVSSFAVSLCLLLSSLSFSLTLFYSLPAALTYTLRFCDKQTTNFLGITI